MFTKNAHQNHIIFFAVDCALASDYPLHFRKNIFKMM